MKSVLNFVVIAFIFWGITGNAYAQIDKLFADYVAAIKAGQWGKAESCWIAEDIAASERLGIEYVGYPAKYDCASPLVLRLDNITSGLLSFDIDKPKIANDKAAIDIRVYSQRDTITYTYHLINTQDGWRLCSSLYAETRDWKTLSNGFLKIHYTDSSLLNEYAIGKADEFIESTGKTLGISTNKMARLKTAGIDYYLVNEQQIKTLTGFDTKGIANLQYDAIITQYLPHLHEIVHLLINYDLQKLPLYTAPFIQEGLAVYLGGRWGKSAPVIFYFGEINLSLEMAKLSDMLTYSGFHGQIGSQDIAYAYAGLLSKYLIEKYGIAKYKQLYSELSGSREQIASYTETDIKARIEKLYGVPWTDLEKNVTDMAKQYQYCGIRPGWPKDWSGPAITMDTLSLSINLTWDNDSMFLEIKGKTDSPKGTIYLTKKESTIEKTYSSRLFIEQSPLRNYNGEIYGLYFSPEEAGLYDYRTNTLIAKSVMGFSPSPDYWKQETTTITFGLDKSLLEREIWSYQLTIEQMK